MHQNAATTASQQDPFILYEAAGLGLGGQVCVLHV